MGSKLPDDVKWSEAAAELLAETDKTSVKAICVTITKNAESKDKKEACMATITDLSKWTKEAAVFWPEAYLVTVFPVVMAMCADKAKPVQIKAQEVRARAVPPSAGFPTGHPTRPMRGGLARRLIASVHPPRIARGRVSPPAAPCPSTPIDSSDRPRSSPRDPHLSSNLTSPARISRSSPLRRPRR